ncbi:hypothetical protein DPMN_035239 [Dreissena polymorpha]|uniref:Uncharacterized protein n=1 Tax=Dreissena polymorpha TaxID=45954 RepID=A0A9D4RKE6_DREPO|nr:hypothetical protein DPMN_035239 [Dreissena polymorpha]
MMSNALPKTDHTVKLNRNNIQITRRLSQMLHRRLNTRRKIKKKNIHQQEENRPRSENVLR